MDSAFGAAYRDLHARHWWWRAREALVLERVRALAPPGGFGPILDVGCGDGLLLERLAPFGQPEGLEADAALVSDATRARHAIHVREFDERFAPGRTYGLILMLDVLEHLDDDLGALRHALALLAPGGRLIITVPALPLLWSSHDELNHHRRRYTRSTLRDVAERAGARVDELRYLFQWVAGARLGAVVAERLRPRPPAVPRVPPAPINAALSALTRLEAATVGRLRPPFGSSLLLVSHPSRPDMTRSAGRVASSGA